MNRPERCPKCGTPCKRGGYLACMCVVTTEDVLGAEIAALKAALAKFGRHLDDCPADFRRSVDTCECGWWREGLVLIDPTAKRRIARQEKAHASRLPRP